MNTVMLVEDNQEMGRLMRLLFELEGCHVVSTDAYEEILPLLCQTVPNVVLMDVQVDGQETINLVRQMRELDEHVARIPVVMTSAMDYRQKCLEAGANHFILKPFMPDEVVQEVTGLSKKLAQVYQVTPAGRSFKSRGERFQVRGLR